MDIAALLENPEIAINAPKISDFYELAFGEELKINIGNVFLSIGSEKFNPYKIDDLITQKAIFNEIICPFCLKIFEYRRDISDTNIVGDFESFITR